MLDLLGIRLPVIQAPMGGVSTPAIAAAVCEAGGLGSISVGATDAATARDLVRDVRDRTTGAFNVNLFCHRPAARDSGIEARWIEMLRPEFEALGAGPPGDLREIYRSFVDDEDMFQLLLSERPAVVSFHFELTELGSKLRGRDLVALRTRSTSR